MWRAIRNLLIATFLAGGVAAAIVVLRSEDPTYVAREWLNRARYRQFDSLIVNVARKHGVDPMLIKAVVWRESGFQPGMVGTSGERGLMQVSEGAAQDWAEAEKVETLVAADLFDAKTNMEIGTWYLQRALERWKSRDDPVPFALAEYNAGRGRVDQWIDQTNRGADATADDLRESISFPGTRKYIETIMARRDFYKRRGHL